MSSSRKTSGGRPLFGAAIPLAKAVKLDSDTLLAGLDEVVAQAGARVRPLDDNAGGGGLLGALKRKQKGLRCEIAGVRLSISAESRPLCDSKTIHSFVNPAVWRGSTAALKGHRAHILIAEEDGNAGTGTDAMFDRATAITLASAAVASMVETEGVIWLPARNAVPMSLFGTEMERFIDGLAPLQFWIRWQVLSPPVQAEHELGQLTGEALEPGVATLGLAAFIGAEIIAPPSKCDRDAMLDHILALASAVIDENQELKDGGTYGQRGGQLVHLAMRQASQYSERPHWEMRPKMAPAPKPKETPAQQSSTPEEPHQEPPRLRLVVPGRR